MITVHGPPSQPTPTIRRHLTIHRTSNNGIRQQIKGRPHHRHVSQHTVSLHNQPRLHRTSLPRHHNITTRRRHLLQLNHNVSRSHTQSFRSTQSLNTRLLTRLMVRINRQLIRRRRPHTLSRHTNRHTTLLLTTQRLRQTTIRRQHRTRRHHHLTRTTISLNTNRTLRPRKQNSIIMSTRQKVISRLLVSRHRTPILRTLTHRILPIPSRPTHHKHIRPNRRPRRHHLTHRHQTRRRIRHTTFRRRINKISIIVNPSLAHSTPRLRHRTTHLSTIVRTSATTV